MSKWDGCKYPGCGRSRGSPIHSTTIRSCARCRSDGGHVFWKAHLSPDYTRPYLEHHRFEMKFVLKAEWGFEFPGVVFDG